MSYHGNRRTYHIVGQENVESSPAESGKTNEEAVAGSKPQLQPPGQEQKFKFGMMFHKSRHAYSPVEREAFIKKLILLGACMNDPKGCHKQPDSAGTDDSPHIPAGYTYLGQFLAHEITFDISSPASPLPSGLDNYRSPEIDLDSLYGAGPEKEPGLYEDDLMRLRLGTTSEADNLRRKLKNDLPRGNKDDPTRALIGDPRNDENLAVAQTHVAFIKFHNAVVKWLEDEGVPRKHLFERAREEVVRHFQWIILNDYLPKLVGTNVVESIRRDRLEGFIFENREELFMPLEFSVAAFRIGHSMVRNRYDWNIHHNSEYPINSPARLTDLFEQTSFSGKLGDKLPLASDWVIDWRRFYDFKDFSRYPAVKFNMARKLDTVFSLRLEKIAKYPHQDLKPEERALTIRNLMRGFNLELPTGEEVAALLKESPLSAEKLLDGPHKHVLDDPVFQGRTPLWFYILKEAELSNSGLLGAVGGRIVAGTLIEIIRHSRPSILDGSGWRPKFGRSTGEADSDLFEMVDLLDFADVVDPIGNHQGNS